MDQMYSFTISITLSSGSNILHVITSFRHIIFSTVIDVEIVSWEPTFASSVLHSWSEGSPGLLHFLIIISFPGTHHYELVFNQPNRNSNHKY